MRRSGDACDEEIIDMCERLNEPCGSGGTCANVDVGEGEAPDYT